MTVTEALNEAAKKKLFDALEALCTVKQSSEDYLEELRDWRDEIDINIQAAEEDIQRQIEEEGGDQ